MIMNSALAIPDIVLQAKIRKNTIPFQAKAKDRSIFIRAFALALALANTRYVNAAAATIIVICTGRVA
jgi:hypothetical protein